MKVKTIGRGQDNSIVVNDTKVSRVHLQMVQDDNGNISVVDLGSVNGTFVNGARISSETRLKVGDEVRIGDTCLPWQEYFSQEKPEKTGVAQMAAISKEKPQQSPRPKRKFMWIYVVAGAFVSLLLVLGYLLIYNKQKTEEVKTELKQLESERNDLELEYKLKAAEKEEADAEKEYTKARDRLNQAKSKVERDSLYRILEEIKQAKDAAKAERDAMVKEAQEAAEAARKADADKRAAEEMAKAEREKAEKAAMEAKAAQEAKSQDASNQEKMDDLIDEKEFNELVKKLDLGLAKKICKELKIDHKSNHTGTLINLIKKKYKEAQNDEEKKKIYEKVRKIVEN